jgi:hypothetical protein
VPFRHAGDPEAADAACGQVGGSFIATSPSTIWQWYRFTRTLRFEAPRGKVLDGLEAIGPVVGDHGHVPDLHHEVRCDRRHDVVGAAHAGQRQRHEVSRMGVDDVMRLGVGGIDAPVQRQCLRRPVAAGLHPLRIDAGHARRIKHAQAGIGGRDEKAAVGRRTLMLPALACT